MLNQTAATALAADAEFDRIDPSPTEEAALHRSQKLPPACGGDAGPDCAGASNYALQNIHFAHTAAGADGSRIRGKGTLIAIVDDGFRLTHQELAGKTKHVFHGDSTWLPTTNHGTGVAAIAAGTADGRGIMGVAPEADLHLAAWKVSSGVDLVHHLTAAADDAAALGAVVQNNSWGWNQETAADREYAAFRSSGKDSYASYVAGRMGGLPSDWQALFDAYDRFQRRGVVVFANSNRQQMGDASAWASLPLFVPKLSEAWLVASNALFSVDRRDGSIQHAALLSAPCGSAAPFCLTSDGSAYVPTAAGDQSYTVSTGTSFAAPQIAGQIALLAQAFPNLSPAEWTARLLATARRDWEAFRNSISGTSTFAPGVSRPYSGLYGHGLPDMRAALSPVGGLFIPSGNNVFTAQRSSLEGAMTTAGPLIGNSIAKALAERSIMAVDALGTDFRVPGSSLNGVEGVGPAASTAGAEQLAGNVEAAANRFAFLETEGMDSRALHDAAMPKLLFSQSLANLDEETLFSRVFPLGADRFLQFAGHLEEEAHGYDAAFTLSHLATRGDVATELSFSFGRNSGSFFGTQPQGPFVAARDTGNLAAGIGVSRTLSKDWSVGAYAEFGSGLVEDEPAALVRYRGFTYASGGITARRRDLLTGRDTVDVYAGVRPTAVAGKADLSLPVGRAADGTIHYEHLEVDLSAADLPLRLGAVYHNRTERELDVLFAVNADFLADADAEPVYSVSLGLKKAF